jgi:HlyD family secretion protein
MALLKTILTPSSNRMNVNSSVIENTFAEHGNEIEDIISNKPPYIVRWGTVYFFLVLLALVLISWFIKYPDIVVARAKLNSVNAPQQVITRTEGKLSRILVRENSKVDSGQVLVP